MFAELKRRIEEGTPTAVEHRMPRYELALFRSLGLGELRPWYDNATLRFSPPEILGLTTEELTGVQWFLLHTVEATSAHVGLSLTPAALQILAPNSQVNVLQHESEHAMDIPDNCVIDVTFAEDSGRLDVFGFCVIPLKAGLDDRTITHSHVKPRVLSLSDRENALAYARRTGDQAFVKEIQDIIKRKPVFTGE